MSYNISNNRVTFAGFAGEHAQEAYKNGYYIEAIQVLHGSIEEYMRQLLLIAGSHQEQTHQDYPDRWDTANRLSYIQAAQALYVFTVIPQSLHETLMAFNRIRNMLLHTLFSEKYSAEHGIDMEKIAEAVKLGTELSYDLQRIITRLIPNSPAAIK